MREPRLPLPPDGPRPRLSTALPRRVRDRVFEPAYNDMLAELAARRPAVAPLRPGRWQVGLLLARCAAVAATEWLFDDRSLRRPARQALAALATGLVLLTLAWWIESAIPRSEEGGGLATYAPAVPSRDASASTNP